jgi:CHASE2 domain-containing sensor protein
MHQRDDKVEHPAERRVSLGVHLGRGLVFVLLGMTVAFFLHEFPLTRPLVSALEAANLDVFFLLHGGEAQKDIVVVGISEEDYKSDELFCSGRAPRCTGIEPPCVPGQSPLCKDLVVRLITAIATSGAKVIGVDLDTSDWEKEDRDKVTTTLREAHDNNPSMVGIPLLVWALNGDSDAEKATVVQLKAALNRGKDCYAAPTVTKDADGVVRGYLKALSTYNTGVISGMGSALVNDCAAPKAPSNDDERSLINYSGGRSSFIHLTAGTVLQASKGPSWQHDNPLKTAKFVLLGGTYQAARDKYVTPVGYLAGVDVLAFTVRGELDRLHDQWYPVIDVALGVLLLCITWKFAEGAVLAWLIPLLTIPAVLLLSYGLFLWPGFFISFIPVALGVIAEHIVEHGYEYSRLLEEYGQLREDYGKLRDQVGILAQEKSESVTIQILNG